MRKVTEKCAQEVLVVGSSLGLVVVVFLYMGKHQGGMPCHRPRRSSSPAAVDVRNIFLEKKGQGSKGGPNPLQRHRPSGSLLTRVLGPKEGFSHRERSNDSVQATGHVFQSGLLQVRSHVMTHQVCRKRSCSKACIQSCASWPTC